MGKKTDKFIDGFNEFLKISNQTLARINGELDATLNKPRRKLFFTKESREQYDLAYNGALEKRKTEAIEKIADK